MIYSATPPPAGLQDYLATLRARKWNVLVSALLVGLTALGFSFAAPARYEAEARVFLRAIPEVLSTQAATLDPRPAADQIQSDEILEIVAVELDGKTSVLTLSENVAVETVTPSQLKISYSSSDRDLAAATANAFATAYTTERSRQLAQSLKLAKRSLNQRVLRVQAQLETLRKEAKSSPAGSRDGLAAQRDIIFLRLVSLQEEVAELESMSLRRNAPVTVPAEAPESPTTLSPIKAFIVGLVGGAIVGVGLAFLREYLDDRFRSREQLEEIAGAPVLAAIPRIPASNMPADQLFVPDPNMDSGEAFQRLSAGIDFLTGHLGAKSFVVTGAAPSEGKSFVAANLARALARSGRQVILVSADLRGKRLDRHFGIADSAGLSEWLSKPGPVDHLLRDSEMEGLRLVPAGNAPVRAPELLSQGPLRRLKQDLEAQSDVVLFDSPSLSLADPVILARNIGPVLLVVDAVTGRKRGLRGAVESLINVNVKVAGVVLNRYSPRSTVYADASI